MRPCFFALLLIFGPAASAAEETRAAPDPLAGAPAPLAEALRQFGRDANRWAYTQRAVQYDTKGREKSSWRARHDPSQPYDGQWTLLERDGKPATEAQRKKFARDRAKRKKDRQSLGELLEVRQAVVASETGSEIVYEVPLRLDGEDSRFPPEKFRVLVTVDRVAGSLRLVEVKLRTSLRVAVVLHVKAGGARLEFTPVLPEAGPALAKISVSGTVSVLLVPLGGRAEVTRTDFRRVTPFEERLKVKLGPLQLLDF